MLIAAWHGSRSGSYEEWRHKPQMYARAARVVRFARSNCLSWLGAVIEEEAAHAPGTLHMASEANINAAMNRFFIPGSL
jgi:hypothetical protein